MRLHLRLFNFDDGGFPAGTLLRIDVLDVFMTGFVHFKQFVYLFLEGDDFVLKAVFVIGQFQHFFLQLLLFKNGPVAALLSDLQLILIFMDNFIQLILPFLSILLYSHFEVGFHLRGVTRIEQ